MSSNLPSKVSTDAACDTDSLSRVWAGQARSFGPTEDRIQTLDKGFKELHIDTKRSESKRPKEYDDGQESTKRQCYDSGIADSLELEIAVSLEGQKSERKALFDESKHSSFSGSCHPVPGRTDDCKSTHFTSERECANSRLFARNSEGDTPVHIAVIHELLQLVMLLINQASSPCQLNIVNHMQQTPIILAALTRQAGVVRALLLTGVDHLLPDRHGDTPLHIAARNGDLETVKALTDAISSPQEARSLRREDISRDGRVPQQLDSKNYDGFAPFHLATMEGHLDVLTHLAELGADVDTTDGKAGLRPLHLAVANGDRDTIRHLVEECYVDLDATTFYGLSPIVLAKERELYDVVVYLVNIGGDRSDVEVPDVTDDEEDGDGVEIEFADLQINGVPFYK